MTEAMNLPPMQRSPLFCLILRVYPIPSFFVGTNNGRTHQNQ